MSSPSGAFINMDTNSSKFNSKIKEPSKLIFQMIIYFSVLLPYSLWATVSGIFARKKSLSGKVVVITGAGRGLGRTLSLKFAKLGCKVACVDVDEIGNLETVKLIKQQYPQVKVATYKCNVALVEDIRGLVKNVINELGEVEIIVNNAGLVSGSKLTDIEPDYLNIMLDVNLKSNFLMIRELLPSMIKRNSGHIVAIASLAGLSGLANAGLYCATKHGLIGLMESLYDELRTNPNNKVQTTCICPYFIHTNPEYSKHWDLRLPTLTVDQAANGVIDAVEKNKRIVSIPSHMYYVSLIMRLQPDNLRNMLKDIFYTHLNLPGRDSETHVNQVIQDTITRNKN